MPHEPKKRHSRQRQGKRRASIHLTIGDPSHRLARVQSYLASEKAHTAKVPTSDENSK